jgi:hypothetical protein
MPTCMPNQNTTCRTLIKRASQPPVQMTPGFAVWMCLELWTVYEMPEARLMRALLFLAFGAARDRHVRSARHGEKMLVQQMAQANKELKAGIEVRMLAPPNRCQQRPRYVRRPERFRRCGSTGTPLTAFLTTPGKRCIYFHTQFETPHPPKSEPLRQYNRTYCRTQKNGLRL